MDQNEERDVLIIGAGAAGGAIAWSLARRKVDVVCLEQGDWVDPTLRPKNYVDWEDFGNRHHDFSSLNLRETRARTHVRAQFRLALLGLQNRKPYAGLCRPPLATA